jgi:glutathione S-transferase
MRRRSRHESSLILAWVLSVRSALRANQAKPFAQLVAAAVVLIQQATLANLNRALAGPARCKHKIKRAGRFIANKRVTLADAMTGVIARFARRKGVPLMVALDWVEVRAFHTRWPRPSSGGSR